MPRPSARGPPTRPTPTPRPRSRELQAPTPTTQAKPCRLPTPLRDPSKNRGSVRSSLALIATAGLVAVALSGCTPAPEAPEATSGQSSDAVVVKGDFGDAPKVEFPSPLEPDETQCTE